MVQINTKECIDIGINSYGFFDEILALLEEGVISGIIFELSVAEPYSVKQEYGLNIMPIGGFWLKKLE